MFACDSRLACRWRVIEVETDTYVIAIQTLLCKYKSSSAYVIIYYVGVLVVAMNKDMLEKLEWPYQHRLEAAGTVSAYPFQRVIRRS